MTTFFDTWLVTLIGAPLGAAAVLACWTPIAAPYGIVAGVAAGTGLVAAIGCWSGHVLADRLVLRGVGTPPAVEELAPAITEVPR